jgi:hypothetical protein
MELAANLTLLLTFGICFSELVQLTFNLESTTFIE